jgi:hypothetical protein
MTSMLVVGATTMIPIMQNSFAYKESEDKQAESNTNTNTNSADSSSTSTATSENTNNINNLACTVAVSTCPKGNTPTPPQHLHYQTQGF